MILRYGSPSIIMLGGVPGVGKSTLLGKLDVEDHDVDVVIADEIRGMEQVIHGEPFHAYVEERIPEARRHFFRALDYAAIYQRNIICEAAYLTAHSRNEIITWAAKNFYTPHLVLLYTSLGDVREAQEKRERSVPDDVLIRHWDNWIRLADELEDGVMDLGLDTAVMLSREETTCIDSIKFNSYG